MLGDRLDRELLDRRSALRTDTEQLQKLWESAVRDYRAGKRGAAHYFSAEERGWLEALGLTAQEVYDFAEDFVNGGEPDVAAFRANAQKLYLDSELAKSWPEGILDKINAL